MLYHRTILYKILLRRYEAYYFDPPKLRRRFKRAGSGHEGGKTLPRPLRIFFSGSSLMRCSMRGERVLTTEKVFRRNGFYEPRTRWRRSSHTPARVNGGLNSTVTLVESTFGRDTRDSLYGFTGSAFSLGGTETRNRSLEPVRKMEAYTHRTLSLSYLHSNFS